MKRMIIILVCILTNLFAERGDLLSFEYKDSRSAELIQQQLDDQFGPSLSPDAIYDAIMYSITYETIHHARSK